MKIYSLKQVAVLLLLAGFAAACENIENKEDATPVVRVGEEVLTTNDLKKVLPDDVNHEDSAALADDYVNRWVRNKLFLRQAESNLTEEEKDVSQLLDEYRTSLLVNIYQQKMLEQKYSPLLSNEEIEKYYNEMQDNFTLQENIIRGLFLKLPLDAPNISEVRRWCRSADSEDLVQLDRYSAQHARMYHAFLDKWTPFQRINASLPEPVRNEEQFLQYNRYYEKADDKYRYFLVITDFMTIGNTAPLSYVEERIRAILLNKKRAEFINSLEKELYNEALQKKIINFY
ncbi:MAG: hypothetical protein JG782_667 [Anaerophaga sp.]|uniref:hypothetical protein n=1 Tax=Anaerophaga thermohalophila TaxID=177400 RepID=UPI000237CC8B|nr:hypothetical protein [Anaerophaga thermohalophila]MBZ4676048.1 hypothetical protein [Anaerophaga sp.]MDI3521049.1 hypothetical protein [Anaerophaga sp.]MDK2840950.1 hypothetical protein [Anaerophaga sp.]MDN5290280.1 hypothetical protein [Anaerophaga sp.]